MANPFQEQLLKAGLVSKKQAKKVKREKHLNRKKNTGEASSEISAKAKQEQVAQAKRNRELNQKRDKEKQQREKIAQVRQLIEQNRLEQDDRGEAYHFVEDGKIKRIFVSDEMIEQLSHGQLAIVTLNGSYEVVPAKVALQILERQKEVVVAIHKK